MGVVIVVVATSVNRKQEDKQQSIEEHRKSDLT